MKRMVIVGALSAILLVSLCGSCSAVSGLDTTVNPGPAMKPVFAPDAKQTMTIWAPGTLTLPHHNYPDAVDRYTNGVTVNIPASNYVLVDTPLTLPSKMNGKSTSINAIYLRWYTYPAGAVTLTNCLVYSQNQNIGEYTIGEAGIGGVDQTTTVYLGNSYPVPGGLSIAWNFTDNTGSGSFCNIIGFGTKIKYAV